MGDDDRDTWPERPDVGAFGRRDTTAGCGVLSSVITIYDTADNPRVFTDLADPFEAVLFE